MDDVFPSLRHGGGSLPAGAESRAHQGGRAGLHAADARPRVWLFAAFDRGVASFQWVDRVSWIASYNIEYFVGVDGISIAMVLLTALLCPICVLASWGIDQGVKGYFALFLLLETGMLGVFVALDFFLFYVFWEVMLLPMYFLIGIWGGARREYAAIKFFLYTFAGSVLLLLAMLVLYFGSAPHTFALTELMQRTSGFSVETQHLLWLALFIAFAIKIPVFRSTPGCPTPTSRRRRRSR